MNDDTNDIAGTGSKSTIFADLRDNYKPDGLAFVTCPEAYKGKHLISERVIEPLRQANVGNISQ